MIPIVRTVLLAGVLLGVITPVGTLETDNRKTKNSNKNSVECKEIETRELVTPFGFAYVYRATPR